MEHSEFQIGVEFRCGERTFRCTDVGSRIVTAIRVDSLEKTTVDGKPGTISVPAAQAEAEGWFEGPPFAVAELVFDEIDVEACEPIARQTT